MIEYDITLNHEQRQVLIYWCAFFVFLCIVFIEWLVSRGKVVRRTQGLNKARSAVLNDDYLDGIIIIEQQTNNDFKGDKIGNGTMDWDIENKDKVIKVNSDLLEELLNE